MKHVVELKYTNPSHEHISLRRRVETINRVVEAQSTEEALNRAANQQRALGFRIQSANIVEQKVEGPTTEFLSEDVELEEGKVAKALAVGAMALASMGAKAHTDTTKSVDQLAKERPALVQRLHDIGASGQVPASDKRAAELQRKQDQEMPASERRAKELKKEEVEQVDEVKAVKAYDKEGKLVGRYRSMDHAKQMKPGHTYKVEEGVEQVDEANMRFDPEAAARPKSSDVKNFLNRDKNPRAAAASKKYIRRMTKLGGLGPNQTKKDTEAHMKVHFEEVVAEASKEGKDVMRNMRASLKSMDLRHGVDSDKREAGYKMSPAVKAAQAKSDALSKVEKPVQAGTLAAFKRREMKKEEVEQVDEAAKTKKEKLKALLYRDRSNVRELGKGAGLTAAQKAAARKAIANEEVELDEGSKRMSAAVKLQRAFDREKTVSDASRKRGEEMLTRARAEYAKKQVAKTNEEVEQIDEAGDPDKRVAGYKMPAHIKAAQAKSDALSKVEKPVQAGTLAALKRREMKKEAVDPGSMKVVNKKVKAAEKMINAAKGKVNKVDLKPTLDLEKHKSSE